MKITDPHATDLVTMSTILTRAASGACDKSEGKGEGVCHGAAGDEDEGPDTVFLVKIRQCQTLACCDSIRLFWLPEYAIAPRTDMSALSG